MNSKTGDPQEKPDPHTIPSPAKQPSEPKEKVDEPTWPEMMLRTENTELLPLEELDDQQQDEK
jgi:hypothetical protein